MRPILFCLAILFSSGIVGATETEKTVNLTGSISEDTYLANDIVIVNAEVDGDLLIAAGDINVSGLISGDLMAAGGEVIITAELKDDLRVAGGEVSLCGSVAGDVAIAGGDVDICADTVILSKAWLAGSDVKANGRFEKKLVIKGSDVVLAGEFAGGVRIEARHLEVLADARIIGDLEYTSPYPATIHPDATITGEENYTISNPWWGSKNGKLDAGELLLGATIAFIAIVFSVAVTSLIVSGFLPNTYAETPNIIRTQFLKCLAIGLLFVLVTPLLLMLLVISVIGIPLAIIFFFAYVLMFFIGFFASVMLFADSFYTHFRKAESKSMLAHVVSVVIVTLLITLFSQLPIFGTLFIILLTLSGIGAVVLFTLHSRKQNASAKTNIEE